MSHLILRTLWLTLQWLELTVFTTFLYGLSWIAPLHDSRLYRWLFRAWCRQFVRALNVDLRLHQHLTRPLPDRYLMIANHPSAFEDIGIPALFDVSSLAKIEVKDWWATGRITVAAGTLFVRREDKDDRARAASDIARALADGHNVALYPEGGVKNIRLHDRFRHGVFDISLRTGIPIVPVFIHYEAQWQFHWRNDEILPLKIWHFLNSPNNRANYHVFDAFDPLDFDDKASYCDAVYAQFKRWEARYLA